MEEKIGKAAGALWRCLNNRGLTPVETLRRNTKLSDRLFFMALGWLAREGNVEFIRERRGLRVALKTR